VIDEAAAGDPEAAERRIELLAGVDVLEIDTEVEDLAVALVAGVGLPPRAAADALHIAAATRHEADFLLTWNCAHIANAQLRPRIERACRDAGYRAPVLCTPDELMGEWDDD
jgi:hypothetical protein